MDKELFMNAGVSHPSEMTSLSSSSSAMLNWASMETQPLEPTLSRDLLRDCSLWEKSTEQSILESALSSLVSSPTPSNSNFSGRGGDSFVIGKLGNIGEFYGNGSASCYAPPPRPMPATRMTTPLAELSGDTGFAERAARFSCFGSRSFNGRANAPFLVNNGPVSATVATNGKLPRVSSTPALKALVGEIPAGESPGELCRKRKAKSKSKEVEDESESKRSRKSEEKNGEETKAADDPYKDFIHVRARRGQATDSHSLAERVRREKISERMKLLQDLVPGCNKVTGKALMLDEIINYVQSLQRQVEFLSMKLSSVNTSLDFNMEALVSKDIFPSSNNVVMHGQQVVQLEEASSELTLLADHHNIITNISSNNTHMNPFETSETRSFFSQLPTLTHFNDSISQHSTFCEDDLHSIIHMGFAQNQGPSNQVPPQMKFEL